MQTTLQGSIIHVTGFFYICLKFWNDLPVRLQWHYGNEPTGYRSVPASPLLAGLRKFPYGRNGRIPGQEKHSMNISSNLKRNLAF